MTIADDLAASIANAKTVLIPAYEAIGIGGNMTILMLNRAVAIAEAATDDTQRADALVTLGNFREPATFTYTYTEDRHTNGRTLEA